MIRPAFREEDNAAAGSHPSGGTPTAEPRFTRDGQMTASGLGGEKLAYQRLLFNLCKSGCTISKIQIVGGLFSTLILYTVEGTRDELAIFEKQVNG